MMNVTAAAELPRDDAGSDDPPPRRLRPRAQRHLSGSLTHARFCSGAIRAGISDTVVATALVTEGRRRARALRRTVNGGTPRWRSAAPPARSAPGRARGRGPVGARPPRAAQPQRAHQEGRRPAQRPRADREHLRAPRLRLASTRPTCAAGSAGGASTPSARPGIDGGRTAVLEPHELDDEYFMLRVRVDGGQLDLDQLRTIADISQRLRPRHRRHHRPAEHPAALDPGRGHAGDLARARGGRPVDHRGVRRHARGSCSAARSPASPPTR